MRAAYSAAIVAGAEEKQASAHGAGWSARWGRENAEAKKRKVKRKFTCFSPFRRLFPRCSPSTQVCATVPVTWCQCRNSESAGSLRVGSLCHIYILPRPESLSGAPAPPLLGGVAEAERPFFRCHGGAIQPDWSPEHRRRFWRARAARHRRGPPGAEQWRRGGGGATVVAGLRRRLLGQRPPAWRRRLSWCVESWGGARCAGRAGGEARWWRTRGGGGANLQHGPPPGEWHGASAPPIPARLRLCRARLYRACSVARGGAWCWRQR